MNGNMIFNGDKFVSVEILSKQVSRVNLIANVIDVYSNEEKKFSAVTVDDSSGQIRVKGFSDNSFLLNGISMGDTICVIGWLRHFNNEVYVVPDIVRHVDSKWALVRRLELIKMYGEKTNAPEEKEIEIKSEKVEPNSPRSAILAIVKKNPEGIDIEQVIMETNFPVEQINSIINSMIESGEVYEPMPGKIRAL
jgi:RPA family protein